MTDQNQSPTTGASRLKPYTAPTLTEYGSVAKLTMAKGSTTAEVPGQKKACL